MQLSTSGGWIKLYRSLYTNGHLQMPDRALKIYIYALLHVNHRAGGGCQPGEGWITYTMIREECCDPAKPPWGKATINEALDYLEAHGYIKRLQKSRGSAMRIRVINWDKYQGESGSDTEPLLKPLSEPPPEPQSEPKQEGKEGKEDIPSSPSVKKPERTSRKKSGKEQSEPDPHNVAARPLVQRLDTWLKNNGTDGVGDWAAAVKMAANALKGKGGPPIPVEEAEQALAWGAKSAYWKPRMMSDGMKWLRAIWAEWKQGGATSHGTNRYQDHTQIQPTGESVVDN